VLVVVVLVITPTVVLVVVALEGIARQRRSQYPQELHTQSRSARVEWVERIIPALLVATVRTQFSVV